MLNKIVITTVAALCLSGTALAKPKPLSSQKVPSKVAVLGAVTPVPINVACAANIGQVSTANTLCASFEISMREFTELTLIIEYTFSAASQLHIFHDASMGNAALTAGDIPWGEVTVGDASVHPVIDMDAEDVKFDVIASRVFDVPFDKLTAPFYRFRLVGTGAAVGDTVRVWVTRRGRS